MQDMFRVEEIIEKGGSKLMAWKNAVLLMLPNLILALIVVAAFYFLARFAKNFATRLMLRFTRNALVVSFLTNLFVLILGIVGMLTALGILHLDKTVTSILAGAGILGLAISFAFQDIVSNFISGVMIAFYEPFSVGHQIKTKDFVGTVQNITLRNTVLDSSEGERVLIPNKDIMQNPLINYSVSGSQRIMQGIKTSLDTDLAEIQRKAAAASKSVPDVDAGHPPEVLYVKQADGTLFFSVSFWLRSGRSAKHDGKRTEAQLAIMKNLRAQGLDLA